MRRGRPRPSGLTSPFRPRSFRGRPLARARAITFFCETCAISFCCCGRLSDSLTRAAPSIRHLRLLADVATVVPAADVLALALPHVLESVAFGFFASQYYYYESYEHDMMFQLDPSFMLSMRDALASASRLTRLAFGTVTIVAPGRMPGQAWATAATQAREYIRRRRGGGVADRHLRLACEVARAAAPAAELTQICGLRLDLPSQPWPSHASRTCRAICPRVRCGPRWPPCSTTSR